jgi:predicted nucleic acid-binding Zn ribbon protein
LRKRRANRKKCTNPISIKDVLQSVFNEKTPLHARNLEFQLVDNWPSIVGETLSGKSEPNMLKNGILYVNVANSAWLHEMSYMKDIILFKANQILGKKLIKTIKLTIGPVDSKKSNPLVAKNQLTC